MSFPYMNEDNYQVRWADLTADRHFPVARVPRAGEISAAHLIANSAFTANNTTYFAVSLLNGGTTGNATAAVSAAAVGKGVGVTKMKKIAFTESGSGFTVDTAGDYINATYDETNALAPPQILGVDVNFVMGSPAEAG